MTQVYLDLETNGLLPTVTKTHCGVTLTDGGPPVLHRSRKALLSTLDGADELIGHNIIGFDLLVLWMLYKWKPKPHVKITDTLVLSMLVHADINGGHSLDAWGQLVGEYKTDYKAEWLAWKRAADPEYKYAEGDEWVEYNPVMGTYCIQDGKAGWAVYKRIRKDMEGWDWSQSEWMEMEFAKDFARQGWRGVAIDVPHCQQMVASISEEMAAIEAEVEPQLPERPGTMGQLDECRPPKMCFKKDGQPTATTLKWFDEVGQHADHPSMLGLVWMGKKFGEWHRLPTPMEEDGSERKALKTMFPMKLGDQVDIKGWLMDLGWIPTMWNYRKAKDANGKLRFVKDDKGNLIPTNPKFHDKGELCKNLEESINEGVLPPIAKQCVRWVIIRHRRGLFQGLLDNLRPDGTVAATGWSCGTPTSRVTHSVVCNVPKSDPTVVLGSECRAAFIARPGRVLSGTDASGLEFRCLAARVNTDEIRNMIVNGKKEDGTEIHTFLYNACKPLVPGRAPQKNVNYGWLYGAGDKKLGYTAGHGDADAERVGAEIRRRLVQAINGLEKLMEACERAAKRGYIRALDGRKIKIRSKHATLNTILQSDGSILVKWATVYMNQKIRELRLDAWQVIHYHDEVVMDSHPAHAARVGELFIEGLKWAGAKFNFGCPLDGNTQIGHSWAEIH